jgi:hypothetical protein
VLHVQTQLEGPPSPPPSPPSPPSPHRPDTSPWWGVVFFVLFAASAVGYVALVLYFTATELVRQFPSLPLQAALVLSATAPIPMFVGYITLTPRILKPAIQYGVDLVGDLALGPEPVFGLVSVAVASAIAMVTRVSFHTPVVMDIASGALGALVVLVFFYSMGR